MLNNIRYAFRQLRHAPGFTITAILTLALGLGANTIVFTILYGTLMRDLPFPQPNQLLRIERSYPKSGLEPVLSATKFRFIARENHAFQSVAAYDLMPGHVTLLEGGNATALPSAHISATFFRTFAMQPVRGRDFSEADDTPHAAPVAIISNSLWRTHFASDPTTVGRSVTLGTESYTIIGVASPQFALEEKTDVWVPLRQQEDAQDHTNLYNVVGRMKAGVTPALAQADMERMLTAFGREYPALKFQDEGIAAIDFRRSLIGDVRPALEILMAAVSLILLIVCANVLSLLLARTIARRREMSLRSALGASPWHILRQLLAENLVLSMIGGAAALAIAYFCAPLLLRLSPLRLPEFALLQIDLPVVLFVAAGVLTCAAIFSIVPTLEMRNIRLNEALRSNPNQSIGTRNLPQRFLVIGEVAVSLVLLIGAGLLLGSFWRLIHVKPGFNVGNTLTFQTTFDARDASTSERLAQKEDALLADIKARQGVVSAATSFGLPTRLNPDLPFEIIGRPAKPNGADGDAKFRPVSAEYFSTLKIPVIMGRAFDARDTHSAQATIIINRELAHEFFANRSPLGEHILIGRVMGPSFTDVPREIVGVVGDTKEDGLDQDSPAMLYLPSTQNLDRLTAMGNELMGTSWIVRTQGPPSDVAEPIRQLFLRDAHMPLLKMATMQSVMDESLARQRFNMILLCIFGGLALLLGAAGLYGVMSYMVAQQTRSIGLRMVVGARRSDVLRMVLRQAAVLVGVGMVLGLAVSLAVVSLLRSMLFAVAPRDPLTVAIMCCVLALTAFIAACVPAQRAAQIEPMTALRQE
jgi:predicted permease